MVAADARDGGAVTRIHLRWKRTIAPGVRILGDAWERGYGDLQWQGIHPQRVLPWMTVIHDPATDATWGVGVEVRPAAFAFWSVDTDGYSLWLDLSAGQHAVELGDRTLTVATVQGVETSETPYRAHRELCAALASSVTVG